MGIKTKTVQTFGYLANTKTSIHRSVGEAVWNWDVSTTNSKRDIHRYKESESSLREQQENRVFETEKNRENNGKSDDLESRLHHIN